MKNQLFLSSPPDRAADTSAATPARGCLQGAALYFATLALAIAALPGLTGCADMFREGYIDVCQFTVVKGG